jgi:aryl-alcohol dehydrogenase-like predicted oxidoreductase
MLFLRHRRISTRHVSKTQTSRREVVRIVLAGSAALASARFGKAWSANRSSVLPMISREIPSSRELLPVIGLGTWQTFDIERGSAEQKALAEILETFFDHGGRLVDSSPMYGRSEAVVGDISAALNLWNRLFLATKVWTTGKQAGIRQMEESFQKLRASRIDLMQVHNLAVTCAIPATSKMSHLRDNIAAGSEPLPNEELRERIAAESV